MKQFSGDRTIDGVKVTVDGRPLDQRLELHRYTANGFEWSYEGDEPRQLALAILVEHLEDPVAAKGAGRAVHEGRRRQFRQRVGNVLGRYRRRAGRVSGRAAPGRVLIEAFEREAFQCHSRIRPPSFTRRSRRLSIETVEAADLAAGDVLVRVKAAGLCHTDLEVIEGSLRYPMPIVLGHEAAGIVEQVGREARGVAVGDHVVLSWNPHCGHCFYCDRDLPILCESYLDQGAARRAVRRRSRARLRDGRELKHLMYLGAFAEYCIVPAQQAIVVPKELPFDRACLIGCGVMTGVGAALNIASITLWRRRDGDRLRRGRAWPPCRARAWPGRRPSSRSI